MKKILDLVLWRHIPARFWTRRCSGNCGELDPHDAHLTWIGLRVIDSLGRMK